LDNLRPPDTLYKLRPLASERDWDRVLGSILSRQELWFASVDTFNDPFEGTPVLEAEPTSFSNAVEWSKRVSRQFSTGNRNERRQQYKAAARKVSRGFTFSGEVPGIRQVGIGCLMESITSLLAWSHYAAGHAGVALGFRVGKLTSEAPTGNMFSFAFPVEYPSLRPKSNILRDSETTRFRNLLLTKAKCWEYEKEWRILSDPNVPSSQIYCKAANSPGRFDASDLVDVVFGARTNATDIRRLRDALQTTSLRPKLRQARLHPTAYSLEFHDVT